MGNAVGSFFSGFGRAIGDLFGHPLDFLSGKSCGSICGPTWDFFCYIENFCVANLLKMATVLVLVYLVLLFFYLLHKLGVCQCVGHCLCKMAWTSIVSWFSIWNYFCSFLCHKLRHLRRVRRARRRRKLEERIYSSEEYDYGRISDRVHRRRETSGNSLPRRWRDYRETHLRKSLRPRSHRVQLGISRDAVYGSYRRQGRHGHNTGMVHDIKVTKTSKFANKGRNYRRVRHSRKSGGTVKHLSDCRQPD